MRGKEDLSVDAAGLDRHVAAWHTDLFELGKDCWADDDDARWEAIDEAEGTQYARR